MREPAGGYDNNHGRGVNHRDGRRQRSDYEYTETGQEMRGSDWRCVGPAVQRQMAPLKLTCSPGQPDGHRDPGKLRHAESDKVSGLGHQRQIANHLFGHCELAAIVGVGRAYVVMGEVYTGRG